MTAGLFTLGAYLARKLSGGWGVVFWIASLGCLLAMNVTVRQSDQRTLPPAMRRGPLCAGHHAGRLVRDARPMAGPRRGPTVEAERKGGEQPTSAC